MEHKLITLKQWLELVDYRITEGSQYYHNSFGDNQYSLTSWNGEHTGYSFSIVFDTKDQTVYLAEACDYKNNRAYRVVANGYDLPEPEKAWDDVNWITLEVDDDFIQKATAIKSGEDYDTRILMEIDLDHDTEYELMKMAHERDITLNQLIEECLKTMLNKLKE